MKYSKNLLPLGNTFNLYTNNRFSAELGHLSSFVKLKVDGQNIMLCQNEDFREKRCNLDILQVEWRSRATPGRAPARMSGSDDGCAAGCEKRCNCTPAWSSAGRRSEPSSGRSPASTRTGRGSRWSSWTRRHPVG